MFKYTLIPIFVFLFLQTTDAQDCSSCKQWLQKEDSCANWIIYDLSTQTYLDRYIRCLYDCGDSAAREKAIRLVNYKAVSFSQDGKLGWGFDKMTTRICVIDSAARLIRMLDENWSFPGVFKENIAVLNGSKKQGLLYSNGKLIDNLPFTNISSFSEGLAAVGNIRKAGYINREGKLVIPDRYISTSPFIKGKAVAESSSGAGLINKKGEWVLKPVYTGLFQDRYGALLHVKNGGLRLMNEKGVAITDTTWTTVLPGLFRNYKVAKGQWWGLASPSGVLLVEPVYQEVQQVSDSICWVMKERKWYMRSLSGDTSLSKTGYDGIFLNNLSRFQVVIQEGKYGIINVLTGELTVPLEYSYIEICTGQSILLARKDNKVGYITIHNEVVIPFDTHSLQHSDALSVQMVKGRISSLYDGNGKLLREFPRSTSLYEFYNGRARFFDGITYKFGFIDYEGREIVKPIYDDADDLHSGLASVKKGGLYGYIDLSGKLVIPLIYSSAGEFKNGQATVILNGQQCVIDMKGKIIKKTGTIQPDQDQKSAEGTEPPLRINGY